MTPYISEDGRVIHGAHVEPIILVVAGQPVAIEAHIMVWWLTAGPAKGVTGQYSMH